jgi:hypothetical protein
VVPPYGETRIEGFRTSQDDVATFRFSSVADSYAGKKGKARNVGVIAVAIFEEQQVEQQQIIVNEQPPPPPNYRQPYDYEEDLDYGPSSGTVSKADRAPSKDRGSVSEGKKAAEAPSTASRRPAPAPAGAGGAPGMSRSLDAADEATGAEIGRYEPAPTVRQRPGLGTEFGEQRYSAATFTKFVRAANRPIAIAELRYNDAAGLMALGIPVAPMPDEGEIMTRETADPFPGDTRFATPPR